MVHPLSVTDLTVEMNATAEERIIPFIIRYINYVIETSTLDYHDGHTYISDKEIQSSLKARDDWRGSGISDYVGGRALLLVLRRYKKKGYRIFVRTKDGHVYALICWDVNSNILDRISKRADYTEL
ncbi:hypothetical protein SY212_03510 [Ligilactobacillus agilis]|uniref:Uncharacterized protein n=1 Tax=Ligilactobacillus agilis TaxID=1601 RepID=A0A6F9XJ79_9LACO|nr:hypothetical protein [Ligilactobacillus agilis]GET05321.1 hypothetical protein SY212_03510 [Ligilactobacillus agilis]